MREFLQKWFVLTEMRDNPQLNGVFDEAAVEGSCPICCVRDQRVERHEFTILWEEVNDPGLRDQLVAAWGFSRQHAWQMASAHFMGVGAPFGMAIIYRALVHMLANVIDEGGSPAAVVHALAPSRADPVVATAKVAVADYCHLLATRTRNQTFRARYETWDGACLPHTNTAIEEGRQTPAQWLRENALRRLGERIAAATNPPGVAALAALLVGDQRPVAEGGWNYASPALPETLDLAAILALPGCPLCNTGAVAARGALARLAVGQDDLCHAHTWLLVDEATSGTLSFSYASAILGGMADHWRKRLGATVSSDAHPRACSVCAAIREAENAIGHDLASRGDEATIHRAIKQAGGICVPHLRALIAHDNPGIVRLLATEKEIADALLAELDEFIRKHDYRFAGEAKGNESTSWYRAVRLIAGNPPDRVAH